MFGWSHIKPNTQNFDPPTPKIGWYGSREPQHSPRILELAGEKFGVPGNLLHYNFGGIAIVMESGRQMPRSLVLPKGKIGPQFTKKILPWVEIYWHTHKRYPSDTDFIAQFGITPFDLERIHASKFYLNCLESRGISHRRKYFTDKQVAAIALMTNIYDPRPNNAKLAAIGVTPEEYNGWMSNPDFKQELNNRAEELLDNVFPDAQAALAKKVRGGDIQALKFYYEITGRAQSPETVNLKLTVVRLIEAVQKHVKDPELLAAIASEIQGVAPVAETVPALPMESSPLRAQFKAHLNEVNNGN